MAVVTSAPVTSHLRDMGSVFEFFCLVPSTGLPPPTAFAPPSDDVTILPGQPDDVRQNG
jgi:hypothetical protein